MGVVLVHSSREVAPSDPALRWLMNEGALGVQLFFIVSALTLCLSWERRRLHDAFPLKSFLIRRFFRVAPMFYIAILLYLAVEGFAPSYWAPNGIGWWFVPATALFLHGLHPETNNAIVPGGWSIGVEMGFYAILALLLPRIKSVRFCLFFILVSLMLLWANRTYAPELFAYPEPQQYLARNFSQFNLLNQLPVFGLGILAYLAFTAGYQREQIAIGGGILFVLFAWLFWYPVPQLPHHLIAGGLFAVSTLLLAYWPARLLVNRVTIMLGRLSYSIFLLHLAIRTGFSHFGISEMFPRTNTGSILHFLCLLLVSAGVAFFSYRYIERAGIAWGGRLIERLEGKSREPARLAG